MPRQASFEGGLRVEVFHHLFAAVAEEMGVSLMRSAFSPNIKERRDFSCALFDGEGRCIAQAEHLPVHLGSSPLSMEAARDAIDMGPGDVVVLNDPWGGGTHLPDITFVAPVFLDGGRGAAPDFYCLSRAHHADVGGAFPGSMAPAADVHGEGLRIPPVRLVRAGELDRELLRLFVANMRVPAEREADLLAQLSAGMVGQRRLESLAAEHGALALAARGAELMDWTEGLTRAVLAELAPGRKKLRSSFEDELEASQGERVKVRLELELSSRGLILDFTGSDGQSDQPLNTVRAVCVSAALYVLRLFLPPGTPTNDGVLRCIEVRTRSGTVVDAAYPAAVAAGNVETSQRLVDVLLGALAPLLPSHVPAASAGTMSNLTLGGSEAGRSFAYYETHAGGAGGAPAGPGAHAVQTHMTNTRNTPVEVLENELPLRVLASDVQRGSGGAGEHAGGDGLRRVIRLEAPMRVSWVAERQAAGPWGLAGGSQGARGGAWVTRPGARRAKLAGRSGVDLPAGAELELRTPGGGGWRRPPG